MEEGAAGEGGTDKAREGWEQEEDLTEEVGGDISNDCGNHRSSILPDSSVVCGFLKSLSSLKITPTTQSFS